MATPSSTTAPRRSIARFASIVLLGFIAAATLGLRLLDRPSPPLDTARSVRGELRLAARALAGRVLEAARAGDRIRPWTALPVVTALLGAKDPLVVRIQALGEPVPPVLAREPPLAEEALASDIAALGEPLISAALVLVSDTRAQIAPRCVLIRALAHRWPERLAQELVAVLAVERTGLAVWEAAVAAGRLHERLEPPGLVPALRLAVMRLSGWGRQYPIWGLATAGDISSVDLVSSALEDREPAVRRHAALYLGQTGDRRLLEPLRRFARFDPDRTTRRVAQVALARLVGLDLPRFTARTEEIRQAYDVLWRARSIPEVAIRHLLVRSTVEGKDRARVQVDELRRRIVAGEPFARVARGSDDPAPSSRDGRIGPGMVMTRLCPELRAGVESLAPGEVSPPIESPVGFHVVQLLARRPGVPPRLDEVQELLAASIEEKNRADYIDRALVPQLASFRSRAREY